MKLEHRGRDVGRDLSRKHRRHGTGLGAARRDEHNDAGLQHRPDAHSERLARYFVDPSAKQRGICSARVDGEACSMCARLKATAWFVEADMGVATYSEQQQVHTAVRSDL